LSVFSPCEKADNVGERSKLKDYNLTNKMDDKKQKVFTIGFIGWLLIVAVFLGIIAFKSPTIKDFLGGGSSYFLNIIRSATATTTTTNLSHNEAQSASTTAIYQIDRATDFDLNVMVRASSTSAVFVWSVAFSNNYVGCTDINVACPTTGNGDWFFEDGSSVDSTTAVSHGAGILQNTWALNSSSTESCGAMCFTKNIAIKDIRARHVKFYFGSRVASSTMWHELVKEVPNSR